MRIHLGLFLAVCWSIHPAGRGRAEEGEAALAVIERAIRAHGGEERLAKSHVISRKADGKRFLSGKEIPFTSDLLADLPARFREFIDAEADGQKMRLGQGVNGDKGWRLANGKTTDVGKEELDDLKEEAYALWVQTLVPLKDKAFRLSLLPATTINGKALQGVQVSRPGHADMKLYFDPGSGLLTQVERRAREAGLGVEKVYQLSDYKDFDGVQVATKQVELTNGTKSGVLVIREYKFPGKVEEKAFNKP